MSDDTIDLSDETIEQTIGGEGASDDDDIIDELGEIVRGEWVDTRDLDNQIAFECRGHRSLVYRIMDLKGKAEWCAEAHVTSSPSSVTKLYHQPDLTCDKALRRLVHHNADDIRDAVGTIHPADLGEGGEGEGDVDDGEVYDLLGITEEYLLDDIPKDPPSFTRSGIERTPDDDDRVVIWSRISEETAGHYVWGPVRGQEVDRGDRWLPATHCRIDGEPPEARPEEGSTFEYVTVRGSEMGPIPSGGRPLLDSTACWDYADTDEGDNTDPTDDTEGEDDPHAHLPGDLRDPEHWTPEDGERVVYWTHTGGDGAWVGSYRSRDGGIVKPGASGEHQWGEVIAARPATLRPEEGGDE